MPMAATPAAEPMIRQLPPVPAQKASSSQKVPSATNWLSQSA